MENEETLLEGAQREAYEEVGIEPQPSSLFMAYSVPHISQVHSTGTPSPDEVSSIRIHLRSIKVMLHDTVPFSMNASLIQF